MLTREKLVDLFQELKDEDVLSVYVDADEHDPANRDAWRIRLEGDVTQLRRQLEENDGAGVAGFEAAWSHVEELIHARGNEVWVHRGWVAFATAERIWHAGPVPARMPHLVRWQKGVHAAPYVRALKQERPVTVALVDGRRARVFEQVEGAITELEGIVADRSLGDLTDVGMRKSSARATGVRGETSTDQAQRLLEVASERMYKHLAELVDQRAGQEGIVVVGGTPESVKRLVSLLPRRLEDRVAERPALHLDMTAAEVREDIRGAAGDLSEERHRVLVGEVVDAARGGGKAALGKDEALKALGARRVATVLLSRGFIRAHPGTADLMVGLGFVQDAGVEEVSGEAGALLDQEAHGVAARLRF
ncbi:MAG: hypothetical protein P8170_10610 [Gemmatimonadota bacterium]